MASYSYSAINAQGAELTGEIIAPDLAGAREQLRLKGLLAESLREISGSGEGKASVQMKGNEVYKVAVNTLGALVTENLAGVERALLAHCAAITNAPKPVTFAAFLIRCQVSSLRSIFTRT